MKTDIAAEHGASEVSSGFDSAFRDNELAQPLRLGHLDPPQSTSAKAQVRVDNLARSDDSAGEFDPTERERGTTWTFRGHKRRHSRHIERPCDRHVRELPVLSQPPVRPFRCQLATRSRSETRDQHNERQSGSKTPQVTQDLKNCEHDTACRPGSREECWRRSRSCVRTK